MSGRALHAERRGHGAPLVLLHGFTGSATSMAGTAEALADEYATLAPDLPGHGRSTGPAAPREYDFEATLEHLVATLHGAGHRRAHWLGYSMGARLALGVAVKHPDAVASLVLLAGRAGIADPAERAARRAADETLAERIETGGIEAFVDEWLAQPLFASLARLGPEAVAAERSARLANDPRGLAACLRGLGPAAQPPLFGELERVRVPVLLLAGALDERFVAHAQDLARRLPHAEVRAIPGAGHAAHLEQPLAFAAAVRDFLRRAAAPARSHASHSAQETAT